MRKLAFVRLLLFFLYFNTAVYSQENSECLNVPYPFTLYKKAFSKERYTLTPNSTNQDSIVLAIYQSDNILYDAGIKGVNVGLMNATKKPIEFTGVYGIPFICQALDSSGSWVDIDNYETSFWNCFGTTFTVEARSEVRALMPCYSGSYATQLRFRVTIDNHHYYSSIFNGSINPQQLGQVVRIQVVSDGVPLAGIRVLTDGEFFNQTNLSGTSTIYVSDHSPTLAIELHGATYPLHWQSGASHILVDLAKKRVYSFHNNAQLGRGARLRLK